jgi:thiol-disulfide isomerase/thioredoxin
MRFSSSMVLRLLGILLLVAGMLKGWQLLTEPVANNDLWSYRPFLILQVEFELALSLWLLSGLLPRAAWLVSLGCFCLFCLVTLYKGLSGAASCGCFGPVHVNPWITLSAIDVPAVIALSLFPPAFLRRQRLLLCLRLRRRELSALIRQFASPIPSRLRFSATAGLTLAILGLTTPILALNKPAVATSTYEVLEPKTWIGKELPILEHIDIGAKLKTGTWLLLLYHYDCPDCQRAIPQYEQMARDLAGNEGFLRIALIEIPPYGPGPVSEPSPCLRGRLAEAKDWFVTTPAVTLMTDARVKAAWEAEAPDCDSILAHIAETTQEIAKPADLRTHIDTNPHTYKEGR